MLTDWVPEHPGSDVINCTTRAHCLNGLAIRGTTEFTALQLEVKQAVATAWGSCRHDAMHGTASVQ